VCDGNPFPESLPAAQYIKQNTREDDRIFVYGSEPQLYFYSNRKSATGYIYMYDLAYRHPYLGWMQSDMIREVELNRPRMIVYVSTATSWLAEPKMVDPLSDWLATSGKTVMCRYSGPTSISRATRSMSPARWR
jgi:hypothetical protein